MPRTWTDCEGFHRRDVLPHLEGWALADRGFGPVVTWFLLGGSIYTAYTFAAVPGLAYGTGALGFFPLTYTVILCPVLFALLPRLWAAARRVGAITVADWVRARYDSPALMLVVASPSSTARTISRFFAATAAWIA